VERWRIEQIRRSLAMVSDECPVSLPKDVALELLHELQAAQTRLDRLADALRALADVAET
jgi:hypothetical protein